jgi:hypothetical protein
VTIRQRLFAAGSLIRDSHSIICAASIRRSGRWRDSREATIDNGTASTAAKAIGIARWIRETRSGPAVTSWTSQ